MKTYRQILGELLATKYNNYRDDPSAKEALSESMYLHMRELLEKLAAYEESQAVTDR